MERADRLCKRESRTSPLRCARQPRNVSRGVPAPAAERSARIGDRRNAGDEELDYAFMGEQDRDLALGDLVPPRFATAQVRATTSGAASSFWTWSSTAPSTSAARHADHRTAV
jgi:hypothetical protein